MTAFCGRLAYDGTAYHGFQYQAGAPTIQGALEAALAQFARPLGRVAGAGRTDTGVHASGQVVWVEVAWRHGPGALQEAWNAHLPADIHLRQMIEAPPGFHPRFDAIARTYRYTVMAMAAEMEPAPRRSPLTDRFALFEPGPLDVEAMNRAAAVLVGEHDFAAFGRPTQGESTVRTLMEAYWADESAGAAEGGYPGRRLALTLTANGFLRRMARAIAGTLLAVGRGERNEADVLQVLVSRNRRHGGPAAPACGLVLESVTYPAHFRLWD